uniref:LAGLIDADG_2 domain-containing protein n=1 Tax=Globodera pallida TaxID=36090 RepID=A0A183CPK2_GLOPA
LVYLYRISVVGHSSQAVGWSVTLRLENLMALLPSILQMLRSHGVRPRAHWISLKPAP